MALNIHMKRMCNFKVIKTIIPLFLILFALVLILKTYLANRDLALMDQISSVSNVFPQSSISLSTNMMPFRKRQIQDIDAYLIYLDAEYKRLDKRSKYSADTRVIFPDAMAAMLTMRISQGRCSETYGADLVVIVSVMIRADSFKRRKTIRETWGGELKSNPKSKLYFNLGLSHDEAINKRVKEENDMFGDIIQLSHYDSYDNQTIKSVGLLRWSALNCPLVRFLVKVDDDCVINVNNLIQFCEETKDDSIYGMLIHNGPVN